MCPFVWFPLPIEPIPKFQTHGCLGVNAKVMRKREVTSVRPLLPAQPPTKAPPAGTNPSRVIVLLLSALLNKTSANEG